MQKSRKRQTKDTMVLKKLGRMIKKRREKLKITQEELAFRAGVHRTYICDVERGERNMSLLTTARIAQAFDVPLFEVITDAFGEQKALETVCQSGAEV